LDTLFVCFNLVILGSFGVEQIQLNHSLEFRLKCKRLNEMLFFNNMFTEYLLFFFFKYVFKLIHLITYLVHFTMQH